MQATKYNDLIHIKENICILEQLNPGKLKQCCVETLIAKKESLIKFENSC